MDSSTQNLSWIDQAISIWTSNEVKLKSGTSLEKIYEFEKLLTIKFPQTFIDLYLKVNGFEDFDWNEHMFSLWSLDRILQEYKESADENYVGFCDFLINSHTIGFCKSDLLIYKSYEQSNPIANNFPDIISMVNSSSDLIY